MKISINSSSEHPRPCLCQLSLGFTLEFLEKIKDKICHNTLSLVCFPDNVASQCTTKTLKVYLN